MQALLQISSRFSILFILLLNMLFHYAYSQDDSLNSTKTEAERIELYTSLSSLVSGHCGPEIGLSYFKNENFHIFGSAKYAFFQLFTDNSQLDDLTKFRQKLNYGVEFKFGVGIRVANRNTFLRPFLEIGSFNYELQARKCASWVTPPMYLAPDFCTCREVANFKSDANIFRIGIGLEIIRTIYQYRKLRFDLGISGQLNYLNSNADSLPKVRGCKSEFDYFLTSYNHIFSHGIYAENDAFVKSYYSLLPRILLRLTYQL